MPESSIRQRGQKLGYWAKFMWLSRMCHPFQGFQVLLDPFPPPLPLHFVQCKHDGLRCYVPSELVHCQNSPRSKHHDARASPLICRASFSTSSALWTNESDRTLVCSVLSAWSFSSWANWSKRS